MTGLFNPTDLGIRVLLYIGKIVPLPAPPWFSQALQRVEVTCDSEGNNGFQLTFALSRDIPIDYTGLIDTTLDPWNRVIIGVVMGVLPEVLIDGVITHHTFSPSDQPGKTTITVTGLDVSAMMDLTQFTLPFPNLADSDIVELTLAEYAQYGIVPVVTPTDDIPIMVEEIPWQNGETDLALIKRLAGQNGYIFYIEPLTIGVNTAYFGLDIRAGIPQSALTVNMGAASNVISISFNNNPMNAIGVSGFVQIPFLDGVTLPLPPLPLPIIPPLALIPTFPKKALYLSEVASATLPQAIGMLMEAEKSTRDTVTCDGTLDAVRYGGVLKARRPVGVRGVGFSYDGLYWVKRVTHTIEAGKYTQAFSLAREGLGALTPVVVP